MKDYFELFINGEETQIKLEDFRSALVDCPKDAALRQTELGHGIVAVTNPQNTVLAPVKIDTHKYIFARTETLTWKVAEVAVLLKKRAKRTDLFVLKEHSQETIDELRAEIEKLMANEYPLTPKEVELDPEYYLPDEKEEEKEDEPFIAGDNGYTIEELKDLGLYGVVNLILEEDPGYIKEDLAKKNIEELVSMYNDIWQDQFEKKEKSVK